MRQERSCPVMVELKHGCEQRSPLQKQRATKASNYCFSRGHAFTRFHERRRLHAGTKLRALAAAN